jgi:hypothetical protein
MLHTPHRSYACTGQPSKILHVTSFYFMYIICAQQGDSKLQLPIEVSSQVDPQTTDEVMLSSKHHCMIVG